MKALVKKHFLSLHAILLVAGILATPFLGLIAPRQIMTVVAVGGGLSLIGFLLRFFPMLYVHRPPIIFCALFILWAVGATLLSGADPYAVKTIIKSAVLCLAGFLFIFGVSCLDDRSKTFMKRYLPGSFLVALLAFAFENMLDQPLFRFFRDMAPDAAVAASESNRAAVVLAIFLWPVLCLLRQNNRRYSVLALFLATALVIGLTSQSQSSLLGILFSGIAFALIKFKPQKVPLLIMGAIAACFLFSPLIAHPLSNAKPSALMQWRDAAVDQRLTIWQATSEHIFEKPVTGWGVAATRTSAKDIVDDLGKYKKWGTVFHPHNMALEVWLDTGLIGVILMTGFLWAVFNRISSDAFALSQFVAIVSIAVVGYGMWQSWWIGLLFIASAFKRDTA